MHQAQSAALQLFVKRLQSRSILTDNEVSALLGLKGQITQVRAHSDLVKMGEQVDQSCLLISGFVGRYEQNRDGRRQITSFYIPGDMADLS